MQANFLIRVYTHIKLKTILWFSLFLYLHWLAKNKFIKLRVLEALRENAFGIYVQLIPNINEKNEKQQRIISVCYTEFLMHKFDDWLHFI